MFRYKIIEHGSLYGVSYIFPQVGDGIRMHDHTIEQRHNVVVTNGSVEVYGPDKVWSIVLNAGDIFELLDEHHPHEIKALDENSSFVGFFINGKPKDEYVPPDETEGTINKPLTII